MIDERSKLPRSWVAAPVEELFDIVGGGTPSTGVPQYWQGQIPWISSADIDDRHNVAPRRCISEEAITDSATNLVPAGSVIVVTRVGLGKVGISKTPLCFSQDSQALVFSSELLCPEYVLYYMGTVVSVFKYTSRGTTISGVTKKQLASLEFRLPPLSEQKRIVEEIEKQFTQLEAAIAALKRAQANLKRYRAAVLKAACEGRLVPTEAELARHEGRPYETADELLKRFLAERRARWETDQLHEFVALGKEPPKNWKAKFKETVLLDTAALSPLPLGWAWTSLSSLIPSNRRGVKTGPFGSLLKKHEHRSDGVPVFGIENIDRMQFVRGSKIHITLDKAIELAEYDARPSDILISRSGTVGEVCVVPNGIGEARISTNLMRIRLSIDAVMPEFFCLLFNGSPHVLKQVSELCSGSTRDFLNNTILMSLVFPLPPLAEQRRILTEVDKRMSVIEEIGMQLNANLRRAERLRQAILKLAFEGKLVAQDPNDESARVLLDRIRAEHARRDEESKPRAKPIRRSRKKREVAGV